MAIIGAGLGGLCLAQGLRRRGVAFEVYEKDPAINSRTQGYRFRLDGHGHHSLQKCLPPDLYQLVLATCATPTSGGRFVDTALNEVIGRAVDTWSSAETSDAPEMPGDLSINRSPLREKLLTDLTPRVHFGKALIEVSETDDYVFARFSDGTTVTADLLLAAEGVNSIVRQ
ncbi:FAD-dependent oxidoreductase [Nocardia tengchongensis]|uniref:FAD-dependent oxidoreductase n=1 Tax=Nocardia tengchongensis TaxID=2055889 RepID=UPI00368CEFC7